MKIVITTEMKHQIWNALVFGLNAVLSLFILSFFSNEFMTRLLMGLAQLSQIMFTHYTFYQNKKSPVLIFLAVSAVLNLITDITYALADPRVRYE